MRLLLLVSFAATPALATEPVIIGDDVDLDDLPELSEELRQQFEEDGRWISGPLEANTPVSEIVFGEETRGFDQVGALVAQYSRGGSVFCSATVISANELATAAHCVDGMQQHLRSGASIRIILGDNLYQNQIEFSGEVTEYLNHPNWTGSINSGADIALMTFSPSTSVAPMPLYAGNAAQIPRGEVFDFVGFGVTGDGRGDSGIKRTADIAYVGIDSRAPSFIRSEDPEKNLCSGDSGGAGLKREGDGVWSLVGVNSFVYDTAGDGTSCYTGGSGITRVDYYRTWLLENSNATTELGPEDTGDPDDTGEPDDTGDPDSDDPVASTTDFGDWDLPDRPPESVGSTCSSLGTAGGLSLIGFAGLGALLLRRRRQA